VDAGEQAAAAVAEPGGLAGQVVVEPDQHVQFGQGFTEVATRSGLSVSTSPTDRRTPPVGRAGARLDGRVRAALGIVAHSRAAAVDRLAPAVRTAALGVARAAN